MSTTEIIQTLVSPVEKLVDTLSGAIGKAYEPRHIRKMAEAKAYGINCIAETARKNSDIPMFYDSTGVSIDTRNFEELVKRANSRLAYQEIAKQQNIESVVDCAYDELSSADDVSNEPVSQDWMIHFLNSVEDISDEKMQKIWGHILADEIKTPRQYSLRTLDKLRSMTRYEAECFQKVASLSFSGLNSTIIYRNDDVMNRYGVFFSDILLLEDCGLMSAQQLSYTIDDISPTPKVLFNNGSIAGFISSSETKVQKIRCHVFTDSGKQLITALKIPGNPDYALNCLQDIKEKYRNLKITAHKIILIDGNQEIKIEQEDLLESDELVKDKPQEQPV